MCLKFARCSAWRSGALYRLASFASPEPLHLGDIELGRRVDRVMRNSETEVPSASIAFDANLGAVARFA